MRHWSVAICSFALGIGRASSFSAILDLLGLLQENLLIQASLLHWSQMSQSRLLRWSRNSQAAASFGLLLRSVCPAWLPAITASPIDQSFDSCSCASGDFDILVEWGVQGNKRAAGITTIFENSILIHLIHESEELGHRSNITFPESSSQRLFDCIVVEIEGTWKPLTRSRLHASVQESLKSSTESSPFKCSPLVQELCRSRVHVRLFDSSTGCLVHTSPVHRLCRVPTAVREFTRATDCQGSL
ncbi:hypothetical protein E3N88_27833 [Mikania micrantha]|uniref:Uncharacterized protein n=1 Tax=Mikania micrantha TaxID=192012 RepID=A0A5N6N0S3_9ASTR|nr:hypothetical protein E3N88_27833 [Mikania micrantha]